MWGRNSWSGCHYHHFILKCHGHCLRNTVVQSFDITGCARNHDAHDSWGHEWMFSRGPIAEQGQKFSPQVGFVDWWAQPNVFYQQRWKKKAWSLSFQTVVSKSGLYARPCFRDQHSPCRTWQEWQAWTWEMPKCGNHKKREGQRSWRRALDSKRVQWFFSNISILWLELVRKTWLRKTFRKSFPCKLTIWYEWRKYLETMQAVGQDAAAMLPQLHLFHGDRDKVEESKLKSSNRFRLWGWKQAWNNTTHINININTNTMHINTSKHHPLDMHSVLSTLTFLHHFSASSGSSCLVFRGLRSRIERGGCQGHPRCPQGHDVSRHVDLYHKWYKVAVDKTCMVGLNENTMNTKLYRTCLQWDWWVFSM